jgi:hypothetical protein
MVARNHRLNFLSPFNTVVPPYHLSRRHANRSVACLIGLLLSLSALPGAVQAQASAPAMTPSAPKPAISPKQPQRLTLPTAFSGLDWNTLTPAQQLALKPLAASWKVLSDPQKRKWVSLSANFERMSPSDQTKLHERMAQWAALSPKQREQARLNFAEAQKIDPQQKTEKWQAYQALSPEEKQMLAKLVRPTPPRTALAVHPVTPGKLNQLTIKPVGGPVTTPTASAPATPTSKALMPVPVPAQTPPSAAEPAVSHETAKP